VQEASGAIARGAGQSLRTPAPGLALSLSWSVGMGEREVEREVHLGDQAVNIGQRLFWCETFGVGRIVSFIDSFGDASDDDDDAVMAIVKIDEACWLSVELSGFDHSEH
jgi:hypothetical protein